MCASACSSAARPSGDCTERCRTWPGGTSSGASGRPGRPAGSSSRVSGSTGTASPMARTAASLSGQARVASAARASRRMESGKAVSVMPGDRMAAGRGCCTARELVNARLYHCTMSPPARLAIETSLSRVDACQWNALAGEQPFVRHEFLSALHDTGCAAPDTGWAPYYLLLRRADQLAGAVPLYLKGHSRGEYVFDYAWADAFERHGMRYYPKLLAAVPFTLVGCPRLLATGPAERLALARGLIELARGLEVSSLHVLFPDARDLA